MHKCLGMQFFSILNKNSVENIDTCLRLFTWKLRRHAAVTGRCVNNGARTYVSIYCCVCIRVLHEHGWMYKYKISLFWCMECKSFHGNACVYVHSLYTRTRPRMSTFTYILVYVRTWYVHVNTHIHTYTDTRSFPRHDDQTSCIHRCTGSF